MAGRARGTWIYETFKEATTALNDEHGWHLNTNNEHDFEIIKEMAQERTEIFQTKKNQTRRLSLE